MDDSRPQPWNDPSRDPFRASLSWTDRNSLRSSTRERQSQGTSNVYRLDRLVLAARATWPSWGGSACQYSCELRLELGQVPKMSDSNTDLLTDDFPTERYFSQRGLVQASHFGGLQYQPFFTMMRNLEAIIPLRPFTPPPRMNEAIMDQQYGIRSLRTT